MNNEQKAKEIAIQNYCTNKRNMDISFKSAIKMADWKDNESKKHNDELIDKACVIYKKELDTMNRIVRLITSDPQNLIEIDESVEEFRKRLKQLSTNLN